MRLAVILLFLASCSSESPTAPPSIVREPVIPAMLAGQWTAATSFLPPGEDWTTIRLMMTADAAGVRGELVPRTGPRHPVIADMAPNGTVANLVVGELPQSSFCTRIQFSSLLLETRGGTDVSLITTLQGRCTSTLAGEVRFRRE